MRKTVFKHGVVFLLLILCGGALLHISHAVQSLEKEIKVNQAVIEQEQENIRVLKAEWAYLNDPQRLEKIASDVMGMQCPTTERMVSDTSELLQSYPYEVIDISYGGAQ